ncbi:RME1 [Candida pseudojiufengensis]|uniref:RME1 n=1 Tax=Candida pseudojiufengensis TaxID=497109 RepID=UPI002224BABF|nr:RME1 [Candida pseudojiufengensis]KAI5964656.1 RME1 [Candida pseudojiufengensis]
MNDLLESLELNNLDLTTTTPSAFNFSSDIEIIIHPETQKTDDIETPYQALDEELMSKSPIKSNINIDFSSSNKSKSTSSLQNLFEFSLSSSSDTNDPTTIPIPIVYNAQDDYIIPRSNIGLNSLVTEFTTSFPKRNLLDEIQAIFDAETTIPVTDTTTATNLNNDPSTTSKFSPISSEDNSFNIEIFEMDSTEYIYSTEESTNIELDSPFNYISSKSLTPLNEIQSQSIFEEITPIEENSITQSDSQSNSEEIIPIEEDSITQLGSPISSAIPSANLNTPIEDSITEVGSPISLSPPIEYSATPIEEDSITQSGSPNSSSTPIENSTIPIEQMNFDEFKFEVLKRFSERSLEITKVAESDLDKNDSYAENDDNYYDLLQELDLLKGLNFLKKRKFKCPIIECPINYIGVKKLNDLRHHIQHQHLVNNVVSDELEEKYGDLLRNELFVCDCGKAFYRSDSMKRHVKMIHSLKSRGRGKRKLNDNDDDVIHKNDGKKRKF